MWSERCPSALRSVITATRVVQVFRVHVVILAQPQEISPAAHALYLCLHGAHPGWHHVKNRCDTRACNEEVHYSLIWEYTEGRKKKLIKFAVVPYNLALRTVGGSTCVGYTVFV